MNTRATRVRVTVALLLFFTVVINYLDRSSMSIAAPYIVRDLGLNNMQLGLLFSAFAWAYAPLQIPGGLLIDRLPSRQLYALAIILWSSAAALHSIAMTITGLFFLRLLLGACEVPAFPLNNRIITRWFPEKERASVVGFYTSGQYVGLAFLMPLLIMTQEIAGWRGMFLMIGLAGVIWGIVFFLLYRDPGDSRRVNQAELALIKQGGGEIEKKQQALPPLSLRNALRLLANRKLIGLFIGQACVTATSWFFLTWFPTYLVKYRHIDFIKVGFLATVPFLAAWIGVLLSGFFSDYLVRRGWSLGSARKLPIVVGLLLASTIIGANYVDSPAFIVTFLTIAFFGNGMAAITWSLVASIAPLQRIGLVGGVFNLCGTATGIVIPFGIGAVISDNNFTPGLILVGMMGIIGAFSFLFIVGKVERITLHDNATSALADDIADSYPPQR
ncbi:Putative D-galactonate transporter [Sodalis praecaptivus]|uniref:Putative D-galactonate transporter n=1 Tax=Sodalis praecaptivus TaxID=1239307 RepID=W0HYN5_9GAMM|nr:MFS transporter [Sodalis praecaptivus]AHF77268.1 Putative D-galactonate transporter [Sodalis praecaptivus]